jgi:hypothetical protein
MSDATLSANLNFGLLGETVTAQIAVVSPYESESSGQVDIPDGTTSDSAFELPFGSVEEATSLFVKNTNTQAMGIVFNEGEGATFELPPNGVLLIAMPTSPGEAGVTAISVVTTATQEDDGVVQFAIFGE